MKSQQILAVDDHPDMLEMLGIAFRSLGWELIPASSGREALEKLRSVRPSLILLDMRMPGMDGFELVRLLREDPDYRDIPILGVTGFAMPGDRERCLEAGCDDYISKPFTLRDLQGRLTLLSRPLG